MENCDVCIINLKKDYGRYLSAQYTKDIFGGKIIEATDCNNLNDTGHVSMWKDLNTYTQSAKQTKKQILQNFYDTSINQYILIFEDDIYLHNDLFDNHQRNNIFTQINLFIKKNIPKLLYFGISKEFTSTNNSTDKLIFTSFSDKFTKTIKLCSGAYGFMLRKDMIPHVIMRIDNPIFDTNPFDIYCLSYISYVYPSESYVIDPQLVVPDISHSNIRRNFDQQLMWKALKTNEINYFVPIIGIMYINVISKESFEYFNKMMTCVTPIIKLIYYCNGSNTEFHKTIDIAKSEKIYSSIEICYNVFTNTDIVIKHYSGKKLMDLLFENKSYNSLKILNNKGIELFYVNYLKGSTGEKVIVEDL